MTTDLKIEDLIKSKDWKLHQSKQAAYGLIPIIQNLGNNIKCIEIGVNLGHNSYMLLECCKNIQELIGIDHYKEYKDRQSYIDQTTQDMVWTIFKENIKVLTNKFKLIKTSSTNAAKYIEDDSIDFIFIDADHNIKAVLNDLDSYWPKLKSGGIMSGHDSNLFSVNFAVLSWTKHKGIPQSTVKTAINNSWWFKKP